MGVEAKRHGDAVVITLRRPPVNAFDRELLLHLGAAVAAIAADPDARCVVVEGSGDVFSAGADVEALQELHHTGGIDAVVEHVAAMQRLFGAVAELPVPTVAAIRGAAAGGGLELALACDLRIAGEGARLGLPEIGLGLIPGAGGTQRASRLLGPGRAAQLVLEGRLITAMEAERMGLVQHVVPDADVGSAALALATRTAGRPRAALVAAKRCLAAADGAHGFETELAAVRELLGTSETTALLAAFSAARRREERGIAS